MTNARTTVLRFADRSVPRTLRSLPTHSVADKDAIDAALEGVSRAVVLGADTDLAAVLTRLMRTDRLDVEVAHVPRRFRAGKAITGVAQRVPLIRDETGTVVVRAAHILPPGERQTITGEAVVDDAILFDGTVTGLRIEPTPEPPGLRAAVLSSRMRPRQWLTGRAVQIGTTGALVVRDGVAGPREVKRSTFYRHTKGWLRVS